MAALNAEEPNLRAYLQVLRRRFYWIVAGVVLFGAAAGGYSLVQHKQYTASAQLLVLPSNGITLPGSSQQAISPTDVLTELQLLTTAPVKDKVQRQLGSVPNVTASEVGTTNVIAVAATAKSPTLAAKIANAYANAFVAYQQSTSSATLTAAEQQLQTQIAAVAAQLAPLQSAPSSAANAAQIAALATQQATLNEELATLQVNGAASTGGVQVVTPAKAPTSPSSPKPINDGLIGAVIGLLVGIAVAFLADRLDDAIYSKDEASQLAGGAPVLGVIPKISSWKRRSDTVLATVDSRNSSVAEAYRSVRTSLQFAGHDGNMKTILVTSPSAGEGKTSTIANLGVVLAQAEQRVVIVSCDLRRPRLGQFYELEEAAGFTSVILGKSSLADALQKVTDVDNLFFLGSGDVPPNPAELLASGGAREIFTKLRQAFDIVLVDSPPLLPVTDAVILSRMADATLLVVAAGETKRSHVEEAADMLNQVDATRVSVILNEVEVGGRYGYRDRYGTYGTYVPPTPKSTVNGNGSQRGKDKNGSQGGKDNQSSQRDKENLGSQRDKDSGSRRVDTPGAHET
jgi:succinoglycan biosynthesis transport protein ExoP